VFTTLWRTDRSRTLGDLPAGLLEHTLAQFGQNGDPELIRGILQDEERRFAELMTRGHKVLARFGPGWQPTSEDLTYLHQTHGLPPDLVTELLGEPGETKSCALGQ
jgi:alanyl-tRNA synthetase